MPTIKELVKDNTAWFSRYHDGNLWYVIRYDEDLEFEFPVPVEDIGNATFKYKDKAMLFMRYIRKHMKTLEGIENV